MNKIVNRLKKMFHTESILRRIFKKKNLELQILLVYTKSSLIKKRSANGHLPLDLLWSQGSSEYLKVI